MDPQTPISKMLLDAVDRGAQTPKLFLLGRLHLPERARGQPTEFAVCVPNSQTQSSSNATWLTDSVNGTYGESTTYEPCQSLAQLPSFSKERLFKPSMLRQSSIGWTCRGFAAVALSLSVEKANRKFISSPGGHWEYFNPNPQNLVHHLSLSFSYAVDLIGRMEEKADYWPRTSESPLLFALSKMYKR
uniref:Protein RRP5 like n=1 Tax=Talaromyces marneffei PM1 TaxID=1077442 RepID=A0A093VAF5_TALMA